LTAIAIVVLVLVTVLVLGLWTFTHVNPPTTNTVTMTNISLPDVSLCASNCIYPSPYLSATVFVNGSARLSTLHWFVNGTDERTTLGPNATTSYATNALYTGYSVVYRLHLNNPAMPIIAGKTYTITVEVVFQDNSTSTASTIVVAGSG